MRISRTFLLISLVSIAILGYYTIRVTRLFIFQYSQYHPPREQIDHPAGEVGLKLHDIAFEIGERTRVTGWSLPSNNGAVIIYIHGTTANRRQLLPVAWALNEHGYGALLLDMPGHGESGGGAGWGISSQLAVERAIDFALEDDGVRHIAIFGFSMGTYVAVQVAAQDSRVNALVLLAAYTNFADVLRLEFQSRVPFFYELSVLATRTAGVHVSDIPRDDGLRENAAKH